MKPFENINRAYNSVFKQNELSIEVVVPIENIRIIQFQPYKIT